MPRNSSHLSTKETIFFTGEEYFESLLTALKSAEETIELEVYIFEFDLLGITVIEALTQAAKRGVKIRVLVDGAGSPEWGGEPVKKLESLGVETRVFHPFPWHLWQWSRSKVRVPLFFLKAIYLLLKINSRNHRKACIVDQEILYTGSFNISSKHLSKEHQGESWRDTGIRLENVKLNEAIQAFESVWSYQPIQEKVRQFFRHVRSNPNIRLNNTWYRRRILYRDLIKRIRNCTQRIWITNAYFIPNSLLLKRLIEAAASGVDVRILLPNQSDIRFMPLASQTFYEKLLRAGAKVFEYLPSILHAKTLILDNWMIVGSSNLNYRSFLHDLELDINARTTKSKELLATQFLKDVANAKEVKLDSLRDCPWYKKAIGNAFLYLKYLI